MPQPQEFRIGTRGSELALWQAHAVAARIAEGGGPPCHIVVIRTSGDSLADRPLSEAGGKRLFVKEIEDALLRHQIDLAVHSSKDMPAILPEGLAIAGVLPREDPLDAVVLPATRSTLASTIDELVAELGQSPSIGTSSVRRVAQLTRLFPGARFTPIRGNLDTRLRKVDNGEYDAIVLASAGLRRLGFASRMSLTLPVTACVPAPGQGIIAIEMRAGDEVIRGAVARFHDEAAGAALDAERAVVAALGGGCQTPVGALARPLDGGALDLVATVISLDGSRSVRGHARGPRGEATAMGTRVGAQLMEEGADEILAEARTRQSAADLRQQDARTED